MTVPSVRVLVVEVVIPVGIVVTPPSKEITVLLVIPEAEDDPRTAEVGHCTPIS